MDIVHIYDISIYIIMYIDFISSILLENPAWLIQIPNSKGTKSMCTSISKHIIMHMGAHTYVTQLDMALGPQASHVESSSLSNLRKALCLWLVWLSLIFSFHLSPASFRVYFHSSFFFPFNLAQCEEGPLVSSSRHCCQLTWAAPLRPALWLFLPRVFMGSRVIL